MVYNCVASIDHLFIVVDCSLFVFSDSGEEHRCADISCGRECSVRELIHLHVIIANACVSFHHDCGVLVSRSSVAILRLCL